MNIKNVCQQAYVMWLKLLQAIYSQRGVIGVEYALVMAGIAAVVLAAFSYSDGPVAGILQARALWDATISLLNRSL